MSVNALHLGQAISTVFGYVDHGGQNGNAARIRIRNEASETDHTQIWGFRQSAIYQTINVFAYLRR